MFMNFIKFLVCLALSMSFLHAATPKDTLIVAVENEPERINPIFSEDHDAAIGQVFSGLTRFDENMRLAPDLATSWQVSKGALTYTFKLRNDAFWHDETKFSAKDVKFTLDLLKSPSLNAPTKVNFEAIKSVEILNDNELKITLSKPYPPLLDALSLGILPAHLLENKDINTDEFNQNPIGTGPYKFKAWKKGQYMSFEANERFYLGKVQTKKLILRHIADANIASIELKAGNIDATLVSFELADSFKKDARFTLLVEKSADYRALMYNLQNPVLKERAVREALNYAVDRQSIVKTLLHGFGEVANEPLQRNWASFKGAKKFEYNPQKAAQILKDAGWVKNKNGILEKDKRELSFEMYAMSNDGLRVALVNLLKSDFARLGIKTTAIAKPSGSFDYTKIDSFLVGWGSPYDPDFHTYRVFHSTQDNEWGWNFGHYSDKTADEALEKARNSLDENIRKAEYARFAQALENNPAFLFLVYLDYPLVYDKNIKGVKPHILGHHGVGFTWNLFEWQK